MSKTKGTKEWACKNINFSKGCSNNCQYCYARRIANRFGWKKTDDWHRMDNRKEIGKKKFQKVDGIIMTPSSHDITPINVELAKDVFFNLLNAGNQLLIVSKPNPEVIRDICNFLKNFKEQILWRFTIGTLNDDLRQKWEPGAPSINKRLEILREVYNNGWETSVSIEPFLDSKVVELIKTINPFVSNTIWVGPMNRTHVPKELWGKNQVDLYSPESLILLKKRIDSLKSGKIRYKDHFTGIIQKFIKKGQKHSIPHLQTSTQIPQR